MKKRIIAICLTLVLALCALPFAAAAEEVTPELWLHLDDHLLRTGYLLEENDNEIAVGDELSVHYQDNVPAQLYINGSKVHEFPAGEGEYYNIPVNQTGTIDLVLKQGDTEVLHRTFQVISSADMYPKVVKEAFSAFFSYRPDPFLTSMTWDEIKDAANHGVPFGNPFLPVASIALQFVNLFSAIFSFVRIVR